MDPLWIVLVGIVIVVVSVLGLRLPAFLALTLGALAVGLLTTQAKVEQFYLEDSAIGIVSQDGDEVTLRRGASAGVTEGATLYYLPDPSPQGGGTRHPLIVTSVEAKTCVARFTDQPVELTKTGIVVTPTNLATAKRSSQETVGERLADEFGGTAGQIGILIAMASIIGKCLLVSGSADRIVRSTLAILGEGRAALSFIVSSFTLGIPVFFDTVFYLMIPLGKAMRLRTGRNYLLYVLTITAGGTMAHSLVPPTPGPLFVAAELNVDIGLMMLGGIAVGIFTSGTGYFYAQWINRRVEIPLRESAEFSLTELQELADRPESELPGLIPALVPILLPVILIAGNTVLRTVLDDPGSGPIHQLFWLAAFLGNKNIALIIAAGLAIAVLLRNSNMTRDQLSDALQTALTGAGMIILITAAGGAFGGMLQQTGVGGRIKELADAYAISQLWVIPLAWSVTALVRTAQGSATVAMITAVGIVSGFADPSALGYHPLYIALAVGCGSKPLSWMNDSGFWVICKMSGMTEAETLKVLTPMTAVMGVVGLFVTVAGAALFPLV